MKILENISFENAIKDLDDIVEQLENKELSLDDSLKLFEKGISLYRFCSNKLNQAEEKIQMIVEENGVIQSVPFKSEED